MITINCHETQSLSAVTQSIWVDLKIKSGRDESTVTIYFTNETTARAYADAINSVQTAAVEQQEAA